MPCSVVRSIRSGLPKVIADLLDADVEACGLRSRSSGLKSLIRSFGRCGDRRPARQSTCRSVLHHRGRRCRCRREAVVSSTGSECHFSMQDVVLGLPGSCRCCCRREACRVLDRLQGIILFFPGRRPLPPRQLSLPPRRERVMSGFSDEPGRIATVVTSLWTKSRPAPAGDRPGPA